VNDSQRTERRTLQPKATGKQNHKGSRCFRQLKAREKIGEKNKSLKNSCDHKNSKTKTGQGHDGNALDTHIFVQIK